MPVLHDIAHQQFDYVNEEGAVIAKLRYRLLSPTKIDVFSTRVDPQFQGKGIAGMLYSALIEFVQQEGLVVKASCDYIEKRMIRSHRHLMA
ncbi:acetyltransferase [Pasteurellaceae bacterium Macca]|nr:acetyltransferase [Pasteurellaceae bacterium Macca]